MNKIKFAALVLLLFGSTALFADQDVVEAIVVIVNDDVITLSEYRQEYDMMVQSIRSQLPADQADERIKALQEQLMEKMITDLLLLQEAEQKDLNVNEQLKMTIDGMKKEAGIETDEQLAVAFRQQGVDFESWKEERKLVLLQQAVIYSEVGRSVVVNDTEIVTYYQQHSEDFTDPIEYTLKAIYVSSEGKADEEIEGKKDEILGKLESGEDFGAVAGEYSEGPEKESSGDLGSFKKGELAQALEKAVEGLNAGDRTSWINTANGYYLLFLTERKEKRLRPFEDCRSEIEEMLFSEKNQAGLTKYLDTLKAGSYIKILIEDPIGIIK